MHATIEFSINDFLKDSIYTIVLFLFVIVCCQSACAESYHQLVTNHFNIRYVDTEEKLAKHISTISEEIRERVVTDIGYEFSDRITIILAPSIEEFQKVQPGKETIPPWASAVAYPERNLIILRSPGAVKGGASRLRKSVYS